MDSLIKKLFEIATGKKAKIFWAVILLAIVLLLLLYLYIDANVLVFSRIKLFPIRHCKKNIILSLKKLVRYKTDLLVLLQHGRIQILKELYNLFQVEFYFGLLV